MVSDDFGGRLQQLVDENPNTVRFIRASREVNCIDMNRIMTSDMRVFRNDDAALILFVLCSIDEGKDIVISPAGPRMLRIATAHGLIRKGA
jgi:hypothetical protein